MIDNVIPNELREPSQARRYIVVAFWGTETERQWFPTKGKALKVANRLAGEGADVHVARVIAERMASEHG